MLVSVLILAILIAVVLIFMRMCNLVTQLPTMMMNMQPEERIILHQESPRRKVKKTRSNDIQYIYTEP